MVLGLIEFDRAEIVPASVEMLTVARGVAEKLGAPLEAVLVGPGGEGLAEELGRYGVTRAHLVQHEALTDYAPEAWAQSVLHLIQTLSPTMVMAGGTDRGQEVLAHVAAQAGLPLAANCTEISPGNPCRVTRVRWGGSLLEEATVEGDPVLLTIALHAVGAEEAQAPVTAAVVPVTPELEDRHFRVRVKERVTVQEGLSLTNAPVVVGGGRGVGGSEGFAILEELAELLGGAVGCTRVVTNNGWRPHTDQVGQTGARIAPDLYVACGISGATQHWVGCMGSKKILAINTDREAPLVAKADYAVIGDLHEVVPAISEALKAHTG